MESGGKSQSQDKTPSRTVTSQGNGMMKPWLIASMKGGHCLTVRTSRPCVSEKASFGISLIQSGNARRAGIGGGRRSRSFGSQRKITRMASPLVYIGQPRPGFSRTEEVLPPEKKGRTFVRPSLHVEEV